jgi:hypothetical protein
MVRERKWEYWVLPLFAGFLVACVDETIQMFVPDRGPGIRDVAIDTAGVFVGIALFSLVYFMKNRGSHATSPVWFRDREAVFRLILLEVTVQQTLQSDAVASLVASHLMDGVVGCVAPQHWGAIFQASIRQV